MDDRRVEPHGRPRTQAVVRIRVADMDWFQRFAVAVLDLILEVEADPAASPRSVELAQAARAASVGILGP